MLTLSLMRVLARLMVVGHVAFTLEWDHVIWPWKSQYLI
jgi:hypothetical protein